MKSSIILLFTAGLLITSCSKKDNSEAAVLNAEGIVELNQTTNGITYRSFTQTNIQQFKGILVMGSGNDENNPAAGSLDGAAETDLCHKAARNGYVAAIVSYRKTAGSADWNTSAQQIGEDYNKCILALSAQYGVDKSRSVVGGVSYSSFMLLTDIAANNTLSYCKGLLAPCGATGQWQAQHFKIPVYSIVCNGNNEGDISGKDLYDAIADPAVKSKSEGITDSSCNTHCGGSWNDKMMAKLTLWLP
jgi:hypothetical protein